MIAKRERDNNNPLLIFSFLIGLSDSFGICEQRRSGDIL
jgi:hypothetical protein